MVASQTHLNIALKGGLPNLHTISLNPKPYTLNPRPPDSKPLTLEYSVRSSMSWHLRRWRHRQVGTCSNLCLPIWPRFRVKVFSHSLAFGQLEMKEWILIVVPIQPIIVVSMFVSIPSFPADQGPALGPGPYNHKYP